MAVTVGSSVGVAVSVGGIGVFVDVPVGTALLGSPTGDVSWGCGTAERQAERTSARANMIIQCLFIGITFATPQCRRGVQIAIIPQLMPFANSPCVLVEITYNRVYGSNDHQGEGACFLLE